MTLAAGATLGPYRIVEQVGRGGMATVYKAYQPALTRYVAIKVLPGYLAQDEVFRERFRAEAITVGKLRHPNILSVFDFGEEGGVHYLVSEFIDGGTLAEQLGAPLPLDYAARMLGPVASALDYAHARDVVHRDVKPSNVLLARDGTPVVSDFGLARMLMGSLPRLTQTGALVGTPEYMAPEQAAGEEAGPAADRYALAVIAYEMLVGAVPYTADTPLATLLAHLHKPLPLPRERNPLLAPAIEEALLKGLAKEPKDRYPSGSDMVRALEAAAVQRPAAPSWVAAPPPAAAPATEPAAASAAGSVAPAAPGTPAVAAAQLTPPSAAAGAAVPARARRFFGLSRRGMLAIGGIVALLLIGLAIGASLLEEKGGPGPPFSVGVSLAADQVGVSHTSGPPKTVDVTVDYSNGRDVVLTNVFVLLRPMKDAHVVGAPAQDTPDGLLFHVGDLGPWAGGQLKFGLYFTSTGSRVVQATARATELEPVRSDAQTINVVAAP